jgi:hypothetical protein
MSKIAKKMKKAPRILPARILMNRASQARSTTPWTRPLQEVDPEISTAYSAARTIKIAARNRVVPYRV